MYASIEGFEKYPAKCWELTKEFLRVANSVSPNAAHNTISELYNKNIVKTVITQNVDSLHQVMPYSNGYVVQDRLTLIEYSDQAYLKARSSRFTDTNATPCVAAATKHTQWRC